MGKCIYKSKNQTGKGAAEAKSGFPQVPWYKNATEEMFHQSLMFLFKICHRSVI